jgi:hypothetical protein
MVDNLSEESQTFWLTCERTGAVLSCNAPVSVDVGPMDFAEVDVTFSTGGPGSGVLRLNTVGMGGGDDGWFNVTVTAPPDPPGVNVTPDAGGASPAAWATVVQGFTVQNTGGTAATYLLSAICAPPAANNCSVPASVAVPGENQTTVNVTYQTAESGHTGTIRLRAVQSDLATVSDDGSLNVTVGAGAPGSTVVSVIDANPGANIERDLCVNISVGSGAAFECGDLRLAHALPTVTTLNTPRTPTLIYNSRHALAAPVLAALVTLGTGAPTPSTVTASLWVKPAGSGGGSWVSKATGEWAGSSFVVGRPSRIALSYDAAGTGTGLLDYRFDVTVWNAGSPQPTVSASGQFVLVDRWTTTLRGGRWLAGFVSMVTP